MAQVADGRPEMKMKAIHQGGRILTSNSRKRSPRAPATNKSISELVRQAAHIAAIQNFVGIRRSCARVTDSNAEVRELRRGSRLDRLGER
jgi:hypothetical protein